MQQANKLVDKAALLLVINVSSRTHYLLQTSGFVVQSHLRCNICSACTLRKRLANASLKTGRIEDMQMLCWPKSNGNLLNLLRRILIMETICLHLQWASMCNHGRHSPLETITHWMNEWLQILSFPWKVNFPLYTELLLWLLNNSYMVEIPRTNAFGEVYIEKSLLEVKEDHHPHHYRFWVLMSIIQPAQNNWLFAWKMVFVQFFAAFS